MVNDHWLYNDEYDGDDHGVVRSQSISQLMIDRIVNQMPKVIRLLKTFFILTFNKVLSKLSRVFVFSMRMSCW